MKKIMISPYGNEVKEVDSERMYERLRALGFQEKTEETIKQLPKKKGGRKSGKN
ncbi:MAG: hypothetical protein IKI29_01950 [Clostridia bacterium]|nr:hypothetical protein [Clostridia bacterium]